MTTVSVAMASYNGAAYIQTQLESLAKQQYLPDELVVCDDGSTDDTVEIVQNFSQSAPFPVKIHQNPHNLGYAENFFKAATHCKGEWIAFCDQDDLWLPEKLQRAMDAIAYYPHAFLILQNAELCDGALQPLGRTICPPKRGAFTPAQSYGFSVWPGFLQTVRAEIFHTFPAEGRPESYAPGDGTRPHDKWTCLIAQALGDSVYLPDSVALYRRHEATVTGMQEKSSLSQRLEKSHHVGADYYQHLANVALQTQDYLQQLALREIAPDWQKALTRRAASFRKIAAIQTARAALYNAHTAKESMIHFCSLLRLRAYRGRPDYAMGYKSALKDIYQLVRTLLTR
jgi:hypothetical protein